MKTVNIIAFALSAILATVGVKPAKAQENVVKNLTDPGYKGVKGKKIIYIPIAMNYDITQAWYAGMKREADRLGYEVIIRDPNWDTNAAVQAFQGAIREKPDIIVTLPPDVTSISRLVRRAQEENVQVIEIQQITSTPPDIYVGTDWSGIGRINAKAVLTSCGEGSGKSGKVALITGPKSAPASIGWLSGVTDTLAGHPDIKVVSTQAANWDAAKSHDIASTVLQQNPDLCAVLDVWDGDATGSSAAIREAGKTGQIFLATAGGGEKASCDAVASGAYTNYVSFDAATQASYLNALIKLRFQSNAKAGSSESVVFTPDKVLTKTTLLPNSCWTIDGLKKTGG